jgi:hypothetical protein
MRMRGTLATMLHQMMQERTDRDHTSARQTQGQVAGDDLLDPLHR